MGFKKSSGSENKKDIKTDKKSKPNKIKNENVKSENKKNKDDRETKNLKFLVTLLTVLLTGVAIFLFVQVANFDNFTNIDNLFLIAPLACQFVLAIISILSISTAKSNKKKEYSFTLSGEKSEKKSDEKNENSEDGIDDFLKPEVSVNLKAKNPNSADIENFYKNDVEVINGNMYRSVSKFDETVRALEALGATDMQLIKVNMAGNKKFDEILNQPRSQKKLTNDEVVTYFMSKPGIYTIKKRGKLNWTFKYSFKSFGMIRQTKEMTKVSIKSYPDAAAKINKVYMALDDSNFPSGPLWFCFNEYCNLPVRVIKWLVDTSYQISVMQQKRTDKLREFKNPADFEIDLHDIAAKYKNNQNVMVYPKFTLVFSKGNEADLKTYLNEELQGVDVKQYTKEYYYKFSIANIAVSMLCGKGISDDLVTTFMEHIEEILM